MSEFYEVQISKRYSSNGAKTANYFDSRHKCFNKHDARDRHRSLQLFKELIGASVNFALKDKSCCSDDNFLNRFLFARKFHCDESLQLLINYLTFKAENKVMLQKINIFDEQIQLSLKDGNPSVLKQRDRRGRKVVTFAAANWDASKYSQEDVFRAFLFTLDKLLENVENQALGFVVIVDWTNFTFKQSTNLTPRILKLMIEGLQHCMPAKFKGIHFIAQPWYVDIALAVIKPFLKDKIKERIMIHGTNLTTLHNLISKDILPPDFGGEGPSINTLDWYHYLLESSQTSESPKSYRLIETTVYTKAPAAATARAHGSSSSASSTSSSSSPYNTNQLKQDNIIEIKGSNKEKLCIS